MIQVCGNDALSPCLTPESSDEGFVDCTVGEGVKQNMHIKWSIFSIIEFSLFCDHYLIPVDKDYKHIIIVVRKNTNYLILLLLLF